MQVFIAGDLVEREALGNELDVVHVGVVIVVSNKSLAIEGRHLPLLNQVLTEAIEGRAAKGTLWVREPNTVHNV